MPTKSNNKSSAFVLELRKTGTPSAGEMAARLHAKDRGFTLHGVLYWLTGDEFGLRFESVSASKETFQELAAAIATAYDDLWSGRAVQYEGMPTMEPLVPYLNRVMDERVAKRRARLLAAEKRAYPNNPRPYAVHLERAWNDCWMLSAIPEGARFSAATGTVDAKRKKPVIHSVHGTDSNEVLAEAGVAAITQAWNENAIVLLKPEGYSRQLKEPSLQRVRLRDYCTKHRDEKKPARAPKAEHRAA